MLNLYLSFTRPTTWGYFLTGLLLWIGTASGLWAQTPACGPNQVLTGYFSGATAVVSTTGTVSSPASSTGVINNDFTTINANSGLTVDLGKVLTAGDNLQLKYNSSGVVAPLQVLVSSTGTPGSFTNITQLAGSATTTISAVLLPFATRYVQLVATGTSYNIDAVGYYEYKCVNNPAPICATGQKLQVYEAGNISASAVTGTVSNSNNLIGPSDFSTAGLSTNSIVKLDLGKVVAAGNKLNFTYYSTDTNAPLQVLVATSAGGPYTNIGQIQPSSTNTTLTKASLTLPLDAQYVQLQTTSTSYTLDAVTYSVYSCVTMASPSCPTGQQPVPYNVGATGASSFSGTVSSIASATDVVDNQYAGIGTNSSLLVDMGSLITAGHELSFNYFVSANSVGNRAPLQIWVSTSPTGSFTYVNSLQFDTGVNYYGSIPFNGVQGFVTLPVDARYVKMVTGNTAYYIDAVTYLQYNCVKTPSTSCPSGKVVIVRSGIAVVNSQGGTIGSPSDMSIPDGVNGGFGTNSWVKMSLPSLIGAGNLLKITYGYGFLQVLVATNPAGPYTNVAQLQGTARLTDASIVLPVDAQYVYLATTNETCQVDGVVPLTYACVDSPSSCTVPGQQSVSYWQTAQSVYSFSSVTNPTNATGVVDGGIATISQGEMVLDLGSVATANNMLSLNYNSNATYPSTTALQVLGATTPTGSYSAIGSIIPSTGRTSANLVLPFDARYIKMVATGGNTIFYVDALAYQTSTCITPTSTSCSTGKLQVNYSSGASGVGAITGTVSSSAAVIGTVDGGSAQLAANSSMEINMGKLLTAGTELTFAYNALSTSAPLQVLISTTAGGSYTYVSSLAALTSTSTKQSFTLPFDAQYILLKTAGTGYAVDAVTYVDYTCVTPISTTCSVGKEVASYSQGAVSGPTNATGVIDGVSATISENSSTTLNLGTVIPAGTYVTVTYSSQNNSTLALPMQVLAATTLAGPFITVGTVDASLSNTSKSLLLPIDAQFIMVKLAGNTYSTYYLDAVTFPIYTCVTPISTTCASGQILTSYASGLQSVGTSTGTVTTPGSGTGNIDGNFAVLSTNSSQIFDFGSVLVAGNELLLTYKSNDTKSPLQILVSTTSGGPYINIAQIPGNVNTTSISLVLPLDARYIQFKSTGTQYSVDALTYNIYSCVASPVTSCPINQVSSSYQKGVVQAISNSNVTNPGNIADVPDGTIATLAASATLVADLGQLVSAGTTVYVTYYSSGNSNPLQVLTSANTGGTFTNIAQLPGSTARTTVPITLPIDAQYLQLTSTGTTYNVDAITFPVYTCVNPIVNNCNANQQLVSYVVGGQTVIGQTGTVTNATALTGVRDGSNASIGTNSSVTLQIGNAAVAGGNSLRVTYSASGSSAPLQVLIATNPAGPYTSIAQLPGSTTATATVNLPLDAQYVKLLTTGQAYNVDAVAYSVFTCVNDPTSSICPAGQQVVSYQVGAVSPSGVVTGISTPSNAIGTPDGNYAVIPATNSSGLTLDMGSLVTGGNLITIYYKSGDLVAPLQVLAASSAGGPFTNIDQLSPTLTASSSSIILPVNTQYIQLKTGATNYQIDAITRAAYTCLDATVISGVVYLDANVNGVHNTTEQGLGGVTVKAYDASGNLVGTAITSSGNPAINIPAGYYNFNNLLTGQPYRLEFSNWPAQYNSSVYGTDNGTSVQFVAKASQDNDFALYVPSTFCSYSSNPRLVIGTGLSLGYTSVNSYNYYDRGAQGYAANTQSYDVAYNQIGVPLGIASQRPNNWVYMAPISTDFSTVFPQAPDGSSAIYIANYNGPNGTQAFQGYKLLTKLSNLGIDVGPTGTTLGGNPFGVQGLGGLDFTASGDTMYVVNMYHGSLVGVDVSQVNYNNLPGTAPTAAFEIYPPASLANCSAGVFRPTALKQYGGKMYMGGVCDASVSQSTSDLKGVVLAYEPTTQTWSKALEYPINFTTGQENYVGITQVGWASSGYFQPVMLDLAFADNGEMVIGTTDRLVYGKTTSASQHGYPMGAWPNGDGTYTLENAGKLGPYTSSANNPATAGDGPGGNWFFAQTVDGGNAYYYEGGLYIKPGTNEVVMGFTDPSGGGTYTLGALYESLTNGSALYATSLGRGEKLARITGTEQVCDAIPPIEIGNRVWNDTDKDGIQDAGEPSLVGVTVELRDANGALIATAVTDANGNYSFSNQPSVTNTPSQKYGLPITQLTDYKLVISSLGSDPSTTGLTLTNISPAPGEIAGSTNTGATTTNNDAFLVNGLPTITLKTGVDGTINHNYDFGFSINAFDLALTKKLASGQASVIRPGSTVTFSLSVINQGSVPAYSIQLADYIPAGLTLNDANWTANGSIATLNTPIAGSLAAGSSTTVNITFTVSSTATGPVINKAEIASADDDTNPNNTPPTDVDSTPDTNPGNDAGGTPNSGTDDSVNGTGKGTPGDTNPATDEDDEDPAIIYVQPCVLGMNLVTTEAHCGQADGRATVTVNTGSAPFSYSWSTGASTSAITGLTGGQTFTVTVTDANGCKDMLVGSIQSTDGPVLTASSTAATCQQANGSATVTTTGGTGTYTYLWSNGASSSSVSGLAAGPYTVRVTDGSGCVSSLAVLVPATSPIALVATPTSSSCLGANGMVTLTVSGGSGPYTYQWDNGSTTQNLTAVAGGTYQVHVTDGSGCTAIATAVVPNTGAPTVAGSSTNVVCFGTSTGNITLTVSGGSGVYKYQWNNGATTQNLTGLPAGIYSVIVSDGAACRSGASFTLTQPSRIIGDILSLSASCVSGTVVGGSVQVVSVVGGTPGYSYLWNTGSTASSLTGLSAGTYSLTLTDSKGCVGVGQAVVDPAPVCALASLGDFVWLDTNANGQQDAGETGVASVTAVLYDANSGTVVSTTLTDGTGHYLFTNLNPGNYYVKFTAPAGTTFTTANTGPDGSDSDVTSVTGQSGTTPIYSLTAGQNEPTVDAGLVPLKASLGDFVWFDTNQNGQQDAGETGVASVTAVLYDANSGTVVSTTLTDGTGHYLFTNLNPGNYYVKFTTPSGMTFTTANTGADATDSDVASVTGLSGSTGVYSLTAGQQELTVDAGLVPLKACLGDYVWLDTNQNGQQDAGETGVASVTVVLYDALSGTVVSTSITDGTGHYQFCNLNPGQYYVKFTAPAGTTFTTPNTGPDGSDSDAGVGGQTPIYSLTAGQNEPTVDAGLVPTCIPASYTLCGTKTSFTLTVGSMYTNVQWFKNGIAIPGATAIDYIATQAGLYSYSATEVSTGCSASLCCPVSITTCALASLGDYVWLDTNQNGQQDPTETGVASVTVVLYNATTNLPVSTTLTDGTGHYLFTNLNPGDYYVVFTAPSGTTFTTANTGSDLTDSDAGVGGRTGVYSLTAGQNELTVDAGLIPIPCTNGNLAAAVVLSPNVIRTQSDVVQVSFALTNPGQTSLSGVSFVGMGSLFNRGTGAKTPIVLAKLGDIGNDGIMQPGEAWVYTGTFSSTYTPGTVFLITGSATAICGSTTISAATADLIYTVGVNMDVAIRDNCFRPGTNVNVDLITRLLIDEDIATKPGSVTVAGIIVNLPKRRFEGRNLQILVQGLNNNQFFNPFSPPASLSLTPFTDQSGSDGGRNTANVLDEQDPVNTVRSPCSSLGQDDVGCEFPDWVFHLSYPVPASFTGSSLSITASDQFQLFQAIENPPGGGHYDAFTDITPSSGAGGNDTDVTTLCQATSGASLGNIVWQDSNQNGQRDAGEPGMSNVLVELYNGTSNGLVSTTRTDSNGYYLFENLPAGRYYVIVRAPLGQVFTTTNVGPDGSDSDADSTGRTGIYELTAGSSQLSVGIGLRCVGAVCVPVMIKKIVR